MAKHSLHNVVFTQDVRPKGLRKSRSRIMASLQDGETVQKGNLQVSLEGNVFYFKYRGTIIAAYDKENDLYHKVFAKEFENTTSTRNQRTAIKLAIEELRNFKRSQQGCFAKEGSRYL